MKCLDICYAQKDELLHASYSSVLFLEHAFYCSVFITIVPQTYIVFFSILSLNDLKTSLNQIWMPSLLKSFTYQYDNSQAQLLGVGMLDGCKGHWDWGGNTFSAFFKQLLILASSMMQSTLWIMRHWVHLFGCQIFARLPWIKV